MAPRPDQPEFDVAPDTIRAKQLRDPPQPADRRPCQLDNDVARDQPGAAGRPARHNLHHHQAPAVTGLRRQIVIESDRLHASPSQPLTTRPVASSGPMTRSIVAAG